MVNENSNIFKLGKRPYLVTSYFKDLRYQPIPDTMSDGIDISTPEKLRTNIDFNIVAAESNCGMHHYKTNNEKIRDLYNSLMIRRMGIALPHLLAKIKYRIINGSSGELLKDGERVILLKDDMFITQPRRDVYVTQYKSIEFLTIDTEIHGSRCHNSMTLIVDDITIYSMYIGNAYNKNSIATNIHDNCIGGNVFIEDDDFEWGEELFKFVDMNRHIILNKNAIYNEPQYIATESIFSRKYNLSTRINHNHKIRFKVQFQIDDLIKLNDTRILAHIIRE